MEQIQEASEEKERLRDLADATKGQIQARPMMSPLAKPDKFLDMPGSTVMDFETWLGLFEFLWMYACYKEQMMRR